MLRSIENMGVMEVLIFIKIMSAARNEINATSFYL